MPVQKEIIKVALVVNVGVVIMDNCEKKKSYTDSLENHTVRKSASDMDAKLNEAGKKLKGKF